MKATIKKTVTLLAAAGVIALPAGIAFATQTPSGTPSGSDTTYTNEGSGQTNLVGSIGEMDPGNVDPNLPDVPDAGDQRWVKVSLPTNIVYYTEASDSHATIKSGTGTIKNLSNYPVKVTLDGFKGENTATPDVTGVDTLKFTDATGANAVDLVTTGGVVAQSVSKAITLNAGGTQVHAADPSTSSFAFKLSGTTKTGFTSNTAKNKLTFSFKALKADGTEVPATNP